MRTLRHPCKGMRCPADIEELCYREQVSREEYSYALSAEFAVGMLGAVMTACDHRGMSGHMSNKQHT